LRDPTVRRCPSRLASVSQPAQSNAVIVVRGHSARGADKGLLAAFGLVSIAVSWLAVHTIFAAPDPVTAAALPSPAGTAFDLVESLGSLVGKTMLIVGAAGAVGTLATQHAAQARTSSSASSAQVDLEAGISRLPSAFTLVAISPSPGLRAAVADPQGQRGLHEPVRPGIERPGPELLHRTVEALASSEPGSWTGSRC
jgi:NADPH:quinone reductase-like Zn-dependent oxidoreductase